MSPRDTSASVAATTGAGTLAAPSRDDTDPLHTQIERAIRHNIVTGTWPANFRLPAEPDLAASLGVNRGTLRRALSTLISHGLIISRRGLGTFVAPTADASTIAQRFRSLSEDFAAQGFSFTRNVLSQSVGRLPLAIQTILAVRGSTPGLRLERTYSSSDGPLAYLVNYVRADRCPGIGDIDFARVALFDTLSTTYGITIERGRRTLSAQAATSAVATALQVPLGAPVLHVEQLSFTRGDEPIEYSDIWINSAKVTITSVLKRE